MQLLIEMVGKTPLMMHNARLADKQDPYAKQIGLINAKKTKTEADEAERDRLEWMGSLYHDPDIGIHMPMANLLRCFVNAGTATKKGTAIRQALVIETDRVPLDYSGPKDLAQLYGMAEYRDRRSVVVQRQRVVRVRPIFHRWRLSFTAEMDELVMNLDELVGIVERAGRMGLGEANKIGMGRFVAEVAAEPTRAQVLQRSNSRGEPVSAARR